MKTSGMTSQERIAILNGTCTRLQARLDAMRDAQRATFKDTEYTATLYAFRDATRKRLEAYTPVQTGANNSRATEYERLATKKDVALKY